MVNSAGQLNSEYLLYEEINNMKQLIIATLLLIAASTTLSTISNQLNTIAVKDQQIEVLKDMLHESNDREREYLKVLDATLEYIEKEND